MTELGSRRTTHEMDVSILDGQLASQNHGHGVENRQVKSTSPSKFHSHLSGWNTLHRHFLSDIFNLLASEDQPGFSQRGHCSKEFAHLLMRIPSLRLRLRLPKAVRMRSDRTADKQQANDSKKVTTSRGSTSHSAETRNCLWFSPHRFA